MNRACLQGDDDRMGKWSVMEDKALKKAVEENGTAAWDTIASEYFAGRHSSQQCQVRWVKVGRPLMTCRPKWVWSITLVFARR
jgi:hypothetical protein